MKPPPGLHELVRRIGSGDSPAYEILHDTMREPLMRYLSSQFSPPLTWQDIEDVCQYTFLQVWLCASSYRGRFEEHSAKSWIYNIARHRAERMIRRAKRIAYSLDDVVGRATEDFDDLDGRLNRSLTADDNTEEEAFEAILTDQIYALMKSRSIREQSILKMRIDDEFTLSAIGGIEGLSAPRIKQILDEIASGMRTEIDPDA